MPDCLKPPNGALKSRIVDELTATTPVRMRACDSAPCATSAVQTEPRARSRCRSRSRPPGPHRRTGSPRAPPKISSRAIVMVLSTSAKTVGATYQPCLVRPCHRRPRGRRPPCPLRGNPRPACAAVRQRAARSGSRGRAGRRRELPHHRRACRRLVVAGPRRQDPGLRTTDLAVVHETRQDNLAEQRLVERDVVQHDGGRLPAEFQGDPLELLAADLADAHAGRGDPVKLTLSMRVAHEVVRGLAARGHDVDHTRAHQLDHGLGE